MYLTFVVSLLIAALPGNLEAHCSRLKIHDNLVTWGHKKTAIPREIEAIIIHSSYNALGPDSFSMKAILGEYRQLNVSPHYIIARDGTIYRMVPDQDIAYHAGKSRLPDGTTDVNRVSIGIEIVNTERDSPTEEQYLSLANLVECLEEKYPVKYLLGHSDIAPGRKSDPWNLDWKKLYRFLEQKVR